MVNPWERDFRQRVTATLAWFDFTALAGVLMLVASACSDSSDADELGEGPTSEIEGTNDEVAEDDLHPAPVSLFRGYQGGCPNLDNVVDVKAEEAETGAVEVVRQFYDGDEQTALDVTDQTLWEFVNDTFTPDSVVGPTDIEIELSARPDTQDPLTDVVHDECGQETVDKSWVVRACSVPCRAEGESADGPVTYYLINRQGQWLIYFLF